jgi:hypothetical protein
MFRSLPFGPFKGIKPLLLCRLRPREYLRRLGSL